MLLNTRSDFSPPRPGPGPVTEVRPAHTAGGGQALDALDRELWRYAGQYVLGDRWYVPGRFDIRECRWNRLERPCSSARGVAVAVAGAEGEPVVRFVELRENGEDRLAREEPRRRDELRLELRQGFDEGSQLHGWRTGRPARLPAAVIGGAACRGFVVPPAAGGGGCEHVVWIDEQQARVRRLECRICGVPWRGGAFWRVDREIVRDYAPDAIGRWLSVEQRERTTWRLGGDGNVLIGRIERTSLHADHWEYRGLLRRNRSGEVGGRADGGRNSAGMGYVRPADSRLGLRHSSGLIG